MVNRKEKFFKRELFRRRERFSRLLEEKKLLILVVDNNYIITYMSEYARNILGYAPDYMTGKKLNEFLPDDARLRLTQMTDEVTDIPGESRMMYNLVIKARGGSPHYFEGTITNMLSDSTVSGYVLYLCDITKRREVEDKLLQANFELDNFFYRTSHDMRAPLLSVMGLVNVAMLEYPNNALTYFSLIRSSMFKLDRFIRDLGEYAFNERHEVTEDVVDLKTVVMNIIPSISYLKNYPLVSVELDMPGVHVIADQARLGIIIHNLLSNAIKFADLNKQRPNVLFSVRIVERELLIRVKDNGTGIYPPYLNHVFEMFFRGSGNSDGSGLGLYIVKKVVEKMNGQITIQSEYYKGTEVNIVLPLVLRPEVR